MAAPLALAATLTLVLLAHGDPVRQLSFAVYGCSLILLFGLSATYHIPNWSTRAREVLRRIDHSNIFLLIAGTYTPVAVNGLSGGTRVLVLLAVWLPALVGITLVVLGVRIARPVLAGLYVVVGWAAVIAMPALIAAFPPAGLLLILLGGALYSVGAVFYALKWPPLWRTVFGYHELFHLLVIGASVAFFTFMVAYVLPAQRI